MYSVCSKYVFSTVSVCIRFGICMYLIGRQGLGQGQRAQFSSAQRLYEDFWYNHSNNNDNNMYDMCV